MPGGPRMPRAVDAGVCPGCSSLTCRPSEAHIFCKPHSSTTFWPTPNTSCRDSMTSHTPMAGTRSPGLSASGERAPGGAQTNGSSASQRARHNSPPFVRRGAGASTSSKSPGPVGGRLILIWVFCMAPLVVRAASLRGRLGGAPPLLRLSVRRVQLLLEASLGLLRLPDLLRLGDSSRGGGSAGFGQPASGEQPRQGKNGE